MQDCEVHRRLFRTIFIGEPGNYSTTAIVPDLEDALEHKEREVKR
jgi:hypothetical protein